MRSATSLATAVRFAPQDEHLLGQMPLPLPGSAAVIPVPLTRGADIDVTELRAPVARFVQALTEVLSGDRPPRQMSGWMTGDVHAQLVARLSVRRVTGDGRRTGARLASVHLSPVHQGALEVSARMVHRGRSRAIACRLDLVRTARGHHVWTCTALEWG